jgi:hypothetical protein
MKYSISRIGKRLQLAHNNVQKECAMHRNMRYFSELRVYDSAMDLAMKIFNITSGFPIEERYSLIDQIRRSSRSVCTNIGEAWRKRRYKAVFIAKSSYIKDLSHKFDILGNNNVSASSKTIFLMRKL